jgi:hypothetical protein
LIALTVQAVPDSDARANAARQLRAVTDSITALRGAAARYRRDSDKASDHLMLTRANDVRAQCGGVLVAADSLAVLLNAHRYAPSRDDRLQRALQVDLATLRQSLRTCQREWDAGERRARADSIRAWGPFRLAALESVLRTYERRATGFRGLVEPGRVDAAR